MSQLKCILIFALLFVLYAWVSEMDYQDQSRMACDRQVGEWNGQVCVKEASK